MKLIRARQQGYTLIEIIFSISFLSFITMLAILSYISIFGLFNKSQSLTRTQTVARDAMEVVTTDLRDIDRVEYYNLESAIPTPISRAGVIGFGAANTAIDLYCLTNKSGGAFGYGLFLSDQTNRYHLIRTNGCWNLQSRTLLAPLDTWTDSWDSPSSVFDGPLPNTRRPFVIDNAYCASAISASSPVRGVATSPNEVTCPEAADLPRLWRVRVSSYRGIRIPGVNNDATIAGTYNQQTLTDPYSSDTTLETIVSPRD
ncbi:type II secretion system protein [Candidatus Saccharibacteria bacterium]|nr:type II secretion system protein [Candidatus Saccharibacteria bacterium]